MSDQPMSVEAVGVLIMWAGGLWVFSGFVAWLASQKGRSSLSWFLLSMLFTPLLAFIFVAVAPKSEKRTDPVGDNIKLGAAMMGTAILMLGYIGHLAQ